MCYLETRGEGLLSQRKSEICHRVDRLVREDLGMERHSQVFLDITPLALR